MASPASYAQLGLPPGADRAEVDRAYRGLMKQHHPDRGGDPARAASINQAYADITRGVDSRAAPLGPSDLAAALYERHRQLRGEARADRRMRRRWPLWLIMAALLAAAGWFQRDTLADVAWDLKWRYFQPVEMQPVADAMTQAGGDVTLVVLGDEPLDAGILADAESSARRTLKRGGSGAAAETSRRCYIDFHSAPSLGRYDRCVTFDNAVVLIGGYGVADRGGFSAGAMTSRQIEAARRLDGSYESIELRLNRLRLAMKRMLAPPPEPVIAAEPIATAEQPASG